MANRRHEFCDPIHDFIRVDSDERRVIDSPPLQRLRHIHQLAMTYLVYPGATHRRFEHSLGTMELAGRVYDAITDPSAANDEVRKACPEIKDKSELKYWRLVVRLAALCHDIGHLPFSHATEELLPDRWSHERLSRELILSDLSDLFQRMKLQVDAEDVVKLAVGPTKANDLSYSTWETILSEIIVGDAFGVDRIDYLLRDSLHVGVAYGNFGHHRLIDTLKILPVSVDDASGRELSLGVESGGLHSAEALLMARYFMYSQVYFHRVRMIYDQHLIDFLTEWLEGGQFSVDTNKHLAMTDNEVTAAIVSVARDRAKPGHNWAKRLASREHFRYLYSPPLQHYKRNPDSVKILYKAARARFGADKVKMAERRDKGGKVEFPVIEGQDIVSSIAKSEVLQRLPEIDKAFIYVDKKIFPDAKTWLKRESENLLNTELEGKEE